ncbi:hypothetical protein BGW36DRAFT_87641 [Talaromyces proteolyticus]|uniref:Uncharacterized protein n=1 Tax=Talaromyces proteolyticus TaxID=1131652 RepID=A0AAD4Q4V1_9EURO|nr:uncharacterized protein BGW36DRAFT_87641 [Talaromyces proteolyticus]KAH8703504.1 hypothetical protein BGW36DRAFT_87641 [Talaromyces proteolyticus]
MMPIHPSPTHLLIYSLLAKPHKSPSSKMVSRCHEILNLGQAIEVQINECRFCMFNLNFEPKALGARYVNGSTIVVIVSGHAAIMCSITPCCAGDLLGDRDAARRNARAKMEEVKGWYDEFKDGFFPTGPHETHCIVWCSVFELPPSQGGRDPNTAQGDHVPHPTHPRPSHPGITVAMPHQIEIIGQVLHEMELEPEFKFYLFREVPDEQGSRGTILVDGRGMSIEVYMHDRLVHVVETPRQVAQRLLK